ncbi:MAG: glycoside hydrolase family 3 N-terminal domain-containing protein [Propioniciclava sp.]
MPATPATSRSVSDGVTTVTVITNPGGGPVLSHLPDGGVGLLSVPGPDGPLWFKDYNGNGVLDIFEDWREPVEVRARALAEELSLEQIAGLMLFSSHEQNLAAGLTRAQRSYLADDRLRNVLNASANDVTANVTWTNAAQAWAEALASPEEPYLPVNISSDPRSTAGDDQAYNATGADISRWPANLGLAATFSPDAVQRFAEITSQEYRAMGITTALGPQIDLATDPRWLRADGTFGENAAMASAMAKAYVDGSQRSYARGSSIGWGPDSIVTMIKHWPGDGPGEGGRESHLNAGKYAVYPGKNHAEHTRPFLAARDSLAVMTSYSIGIAADGSPLTGNRVGSGYDPAKIDLLRDSGYDGVICTDWGVTLGYTDPDSPFGMAWGMEHASVAERHFAVLRAGVDMFGGNNTTGPVLAAYRRWQNAYEAGEVAVSADERFRISAARILRMIMAPGLFENPYLDLDVSRAVVASPDKVAAGLRTQADSVVMLKNDDATIAASTPARYARQAVYIPCSIGHGFTGVFGTTPDTVGPTLDVAVAGEYFAEVLTDTPVHDADGTVVGHTMPDLTGVDVVLVGLRGPDNGDNFTGAGLDADGSFYPLSLQWGPYTADGPHVRRTSIAGDLAPDGTQENRSYYGASSRIGNADDLAVLRRVSAAIAAREEAGTGTIPIIVAVKARTAFIPAEIEPHADALLVGYSVSDRVLIEVALGLSEPHGRLPITAPKDMDAVEAQAEDVGEDTEPYVDPVGRVWRFGYGLDWEGVIA